MITASSALDQIKVIIDRWGNCSTIELDEHYLEQVERIISVHRRLEQALKNMIEYENDKKLAGQSTLPIEEISYEDKE